MRRLMMAAVLVTAMAACAKKETQSTGTDTTVANAHVKDTTIVTHDTTVKVDTVKKTDHKP